MWKFLQAISTDLFRIPRYRKENGDLNPNYDEQSYIWRLKNVSMLSVLAATVILHLVQVHGYALGEGFASNQDVKEIQISQLEERLEKYYTALCMSPGRPELLELIRELQAKYERLTGNRYEPLECELLLQINA